MSDDRYDIPDIPDVPGEGGERGRREGRKRQGARRRWPWLLAGLVLGVAGVLLLPRYFGPYLPNFLGTDELVIRGQVVATERQEERLLLTVDSERGAILVTYRERVDEIGLLIAEGDSVVLRTREFRPFLEGPELVGVRKGRWGTGAGAGRGAGAAASDTAPAGPDTLSRPDTADTDSAPAAGGAASDTSSGR